jgi:hypothetical protein
MKATFLLADYAKVSDGKLDILGGGWSVAGPGPVAFVAAGLVQIPWDQTNMTHTIRLELLDADGTPVPHPVNEGPIFAEFQVEVGRPPGVKPGTPMDVPVAVPFGAFQLEPGERYEVRVTIDGTDDEDWTLPFSIRPAPAQPLGT